MADYEPVVTVKDYKQNRYGFSVDIQHPDTGQTIARVVYSPHKPLKCGAVCWITSEMPVQVNTKLQ